MPGVGVGSAVGTVVAVGVGGGVAVARLAGVEVITGTGVGEGTTVDGAPQPATTIKMRTAMAKRVVHRAGVMGSSYRDERMKVMPRGSQVTMPSIWSRTPSQRSRER